MRRSCLVLSTIAFAGFGRAWSESTPFADFEARTVSNSLGGYFYFFDDRADSGSSVITSQDSVSHTWDSSSFAPGAEGSEASARLAFRYGSNSPKCGDACTYPPLVGMGSSLLSGGTLDLTGATAISFRAKATAPMKVSFSVNVTDVTQGGADYSKLLEVGTEWTKFTVHLPPAADMEQPGWATPVAFDPVDAKGMGWTIGKGDNPSLSSGTFYLDDVVIEDWTLQPDPSALRAGSPPSRYAFRIATRAATPIFNRTGSRPADARGRAVPRAEAP